MDKKDRRIRALEDALECCIKRAQKAEKKLKHQIAKHGGYKSTSKRLNINLKGDERV